MSVALLFFLTCRKAAVRIWQQYHLSEGATEVKYQCEVERDDQGEKDIRSVRRTHQKVKDTCQTQIK
jgi:hypothetical protein